MVYKTEPHTSKTTDVQPILDYFKRKRDEYRDLYYERQNLQVLGKYKAYADAYEFVLNNALEQ